MAKRNVQDATLVNNRKTRRDVAELKRLVMAALKRIAKLEKARK